jgi:hypothetical protein
MWLRTRLVIKCGCDISHHNARKLGEMMGEEQGGTEQQMDFSV